MIERSIRIEEERYKQLKDISEKESLPISYLFRFAISNLVKAYNNGISLAEFSALVDKREQAI